VNKTADELTRDSNSEIERRIQTMAAKLELMAERFANGVIGTDQAHSIIHKVMAECMDEWQTSQSHANTLTVLYRETGADLTRAVDDLIEAERQLSRANDRADMYLLRMTRAKEALA
jgi:hypothetical protein